LIKTKSLTNNYNIETFLFCSLILILSFIELEIRSKSLIFIILLIFFYNYKNKDKYKFGFTFKFNKISYLIIIFIALIINQNTYLNFEIISIDVPSYLVASRSINFFELPFSNQWESKGPLFIYFYRFLLLISNNNYLFFRILNDLLLFLITYLIFSTSYKISNNYFTAFISSIFFVSITSHVWYVTELSEIYCLVFILYQYYIISSRPITKKTILLCGVLVSISSLINQSTAIFLIGCIFYIYKEINLKELNYYFTLLLGFLIPQIIFYLLYFFNDLSILYFTNYIKIPFGYVGSGEFQLYELIVWLRRYFNFSQLLYFSFLSVFFVLAIKLLKKQFFKSFRFNLNILYLILGFLIYVIAGHNYQHHLFYTIAFFSILISHLEINKLTSVIYVLIIFSAIHIFSFSFDKSFNNLINYEETFDNYPLRSLASEINNLYEDKNYEVLAIDHVLLLFYLEKPNISYIIHPFNNFEEYIVNALLETGKLKTNDSSHLSYYIETEPEIIICAPQTIIDGSPTKLGSDIFNCEITDYKKNYIKLDTQIYLDNPNREYYYNPYISIDVFIKTKDSS
tara:strand:+ start:24712 stop:26421 length:1710 start_codon:yes stop_codon:yes gene_type:complete